MFFEIQNQPTGYATIFCSSTSITLAELNRITDQSDTSSVDQFNSSVYTAKYTSEFSIQFRSDNSERSWSTMLKIVPGNEIACTTRPRGRTAPRLGCQSNIKPCQHLTSDSSQYRNFSSFKFFPTYTTAQPALVENALAQIQRTTWRGVHYALGVFDQRRAGRSCSRLAAPRLAPARPAGGGGDGGTRRRRGLGYVTSRRVRPTQVTGRSAGLLRVVTRCVVLLYIFSRIQSNSAEQYMENYKNRLLLKKKYSNVAIANWEYNGLPQHGQQPDDTVKVASLRCLHLIQDFTLWKELLFGEPRVLHPACAVHTIYARLLTTHYQSLSERGSEWCLPSRCTQTR
ncbi:hypothetical protein EVAR_55971_1 [Eumeta japonica]|uniref:Uncharacterized protein n=1 Tax=Eumeta variegata TaxID=151549 RepID=A0A4C1YR44_EUMVA|nr:hypothetical protein EVAR_55971_1 [Eumeta japonica]